MDDSDWHGRSPVPFDIRRYAPDHFTEEEHEQARRRGYEDAADRWAELMDYRLWKDWAESVPERARDATKRGLESVGVPKRLLGAVGRAAGSLPVRGAGRTYDPGQVSFGNALVDQVRDVVSAMEKLGASPNTDESEISVSDRERFQELKSQLNGALKRLYELDLDGELRRAASSPPRRVSEESMVGDYVPKDPELRRIADAYKADVEAYEAKRQKWRERRGFTADGNPCVRRMPPQTDRLLSPSNEEDENVWPSEDEETEEFAESADDWGVSDEGDF